MTTWLIVAGSTALAFLFTFIQGRLSGAEAERNSNRAKEADSYETDLQEIADAVAARNAVRPDSMPGNDKYRRD